MKKFYLLASGACVLVLILASAALAADITVTRTDDPTPNPCVSGVDCSLREAVIQAEGNSGSDKIILGANTYILSIPEAGTAESGDLDYDGDGGPLTIQGAGESATVIQADPGLDSRLIQTEDDTTLTVSNLTLRKGKDDIGGAILVPFGETNLTLVDCSFLENESTGGGGGALFFNSTGTLLIQNGSFQENIADTDGGGAIFMTGGDNSAQHLMEGTSFTENQVFNGQGGALSIGGFYDVKLSGVQMVGNIANDSAGGAIAGIFTGDFALENSTIQGNKSQELGAGVFLDNSGTAEVKDSTFRGNEMIGSGGMGGGLALELASQGTLISGSTFSGNNADSGGGLEILSSSGGAIEITNSTFSDNRATSHGGGIHIFAHSFTSLNNVTLVGNIASQGAGIANEDPDSKAYQVRNSLFAQNDATGDSSDDCSGPVNSAGYNLVAGPNNINCGLPSDPTNLVGVDPKIGILANNGGPTQTHILLTGSPAIDGGNPSGCKDGSGNDLTVDQRGEPRPEGGACDIGAVEVPATLPPSPSPQPPDDSGQTGDSGGCRLADYERSSSSQAMGTFAGIIFIFSVFFYARRKSAQS